MCLDCGYAASAELSHFGASDKTWFLLAAPAARVSSISAIRMLNWFCSRRWIGSVRWWRSCIIGRHFRRSCTSASSSERATLAFYRSFIVSGLLPIVAAIMMGADSDPSSKANCSVWTALEQFVTKTALAKLWELSDSIQPANNASKNKVKFKVR